MANHNEIMDKLTALLSEYVDLRYMCDYESCYDDELEELYCLVMDEKGVQDND